MADFICAAWGFRELSAEEYFAAARGLGFTKVEINLGGDDNAHLRTDASVSTIAAIREQSKRAGLKIVALAGGNDFTVPDRRERDRQVDAVMRQIRLCADLGTPILRIFAGFASEDRITARTYEDVRSALHAVSRMAADNHVTLAVENHGGITRTGERCLQLLGDLEHDSRSGAGARSIGWNYDPANFRHGGEDPLAALQVIQGMIVYSHWKDVKIEAGGLEYCEVGAGIIDWAPIVAALHQSGYSGYWAIEYETPADVERGTRDSLAYLRRLLAAPE